MLTVTVLFPAVLFLASDPAAGEQSLWVALQHGLAHHQVLTAEGNSDPWLRKKKHPCALGRE